jgi:hypothetical protein
MNYDEKLLAFVRNLASLNVHAYDNEEAWDKLSDLSYDAGQLLKEIGE